MLISCRSQRYLKLQEFQGVTRFERVRHASILKLDIFVLNLYHRNLENHLPTDSQMGALCIRLR